MSTRSFVLLIVGTLIILMLTTPKVLPHQVCGSATPVRVEQTHGTIYKTMGITCSNNKEYICTILIGIPRCDEVNGYTYYAEYGPHGEITWETIAVKP